MAERALEWKTVKSFLAYYQKLTVQSVLQSFPRPLAPPTGGGVLTRGWQPALHDDPAWARRGRLRESEQCRAEASQARRHLGVYAGHLVC